MGARRVHYCNRCHWRPAPHGAICDDCFNEETERIAEKARQAKPGKASRKRPAKKKSVH
jgi:hypothetical protein